MTTNMNNHRANVYELQKFLRTIKLVDQKTTNLINPDGIYGSETTDAVREFQKEHSLPITGEADFATWTRIYEEYLIALEMITAASAIRGYPSGVDVLKFGDIFDEIFILQFLLRKYEERTGSDKRVEMNGIFDENTENAVKDIQGLLNLSKSGTVDKALWNRLALYHNAHYINE